jgi:uncharacterized protein YdaT
MPNRNKNAFYVEPHKDGGYSVTKGGANRASDIKDTQKEAVQRAHQIDPNAPVHIARVRHTSKGDPDQYRKE